MRTCFHCGRMRRQRSTTLPVGFCARPECKSARTSLTEALRRGEVDLDVLTLPWVLQTYDGEEDGRIFENRAAGLHWIRLFRPSAWTHGWRTESDGFIQIGMDDRWASLRREA